MSKSEQARQLRAEHPEWTVAQIARAVGITDSTVRQALEQKRSDEPVSTWTQAGETATATLIGPNVKTLDDLLAHFKVDLSKWEVVSFETKTWPTTMREPATTVGGRGDSAMVAESPKGGKSTLWTRGSHKPVQVVNVAVSARFRLKIVEQKLRAVFAEMLEGFKAAAPRRARVSDCNTGKPRGDMLEVSLFDVHFGKLCWGKETGARYDQEIARDLLHDAVDALLARSSGFAPGRILLPVGNDFFNIDNSRNGTTAGTPQDVDSRWQRSFVEGRKAMVEVIDRLREVAPVHVVIVSGNHDTERSFYLGDVLTAWYRNTQDVEIDNSPTQRKYVQWGKCLIGFTHGDNEKHRDLPLIMASEAPQQWAATQYRELHLGHYHTTRVTEHHGVRVRIIPSLCPPDAWHKSKGYEGLRSAEAFVWNQEQGCVATFAFQP